MVLVASADPTSILSILHDTAKLSNKNILSIGVFTYFVPSFRSISKLARAKAMGKRKRTI